MAPVALAGEASGAAAAGGNVLGGVTGGYVEPSKDLAERFRPGQVVVRYGGAHVASVGGGPKVATLARGPPVISRRPYCAMKRT